jgi:hypothetical protein
MKTQRSWRLVLILLATAATFTACHKSSSERKNCKIVDATAQAGVDIDISYNTDGSIKQVTDGIGTVYTFSYSGDSVVVLNTDSGIFQARTVYANNSAGLKTYERIEYDQAGIQWSVTNYEYNGEELSKATTTTSSGNAPDINIFQWFNHNLVAQTSGYGTSAASTTTYDYYLDKPEQSGDYFSFFQAIQGGETIRNKNLLKSATGDTFNYTFGADGNISALEIVGAGSAAVLNYSYQCH